MSVSRRTALAGGLAVAACGPALRGGPFPLGISTGDPTPTQLTVTSCYRGSGVALFQFLDSTGRAVREVRLTPTEGGFVRFELEGLSPATTYRYQLTHDAGPELLEGRARTAPPAGSRPQIRLGAVSCLFQTNPYDVLARAAEQPTLDAFLLLGDTVYADGAVSRAEYRSKWAEGFGRAESVALRAAHSVIATWDDHEFTDDYTPQLLSAEQSATAKAAFDEHLPIRRDRPDILWRRFRFGDTLDVFCLDCRAERDAARKQYLSAAQVNWFIEGMQRSQATFKLVMNSVPVGQFPGAFFGVATPDRWEGYPEQRSTVLTALDAVTGVVWVSGDFHIGTVGRVALEGPGARQTEILVGPGASLANPAPSYPSGPQWDFVTGRNTFSTFTFKPDVQEVTVDFIDGRGRTLHAQTLKVA